MRRTTTFLIICLNLTLRGQSPLTWDDFETMLATNPRFQMAVHEGLSRKPADKTSWSFDLGLQGQKDRPETMAEDPLPQNLRAGGSVGVQHGGISVQAGGGLRFDPKDLDPLLKLTMDFEAFFQLGLALHWTWKGNGRDRFWNWERRQSHMNARLEALEWFERWLTAELDATSAQRRAIFWDKKLEAARLLSESDQTPRWTYQEMQLEHRVAQIHWKKSSQDLDSLRGQISSKLGIEAVHHRPVPEAPTVALPNPHILPEELEWIVFQDELIDLRETRAPRLQIRVGWSRVDMTQRLEAELGLHWKPGGHEAETHHLEYLRQRALLSRHDWGDMILEYQRGLVAFEEEKSHLNEVLQTRRRQLSILEDLQTADVEILQKRWETEQRILEILELLDSLQIRRFVFITRLRLLSDAIDQL